MGWSRSTPQVAPRRPAVALKWVSNPTKSWQKLIEHYLLKRENLRAVIFIIDIRRGITNLDADLKNWLEANDLEFLLVVTKADKLSTVEKRNQLM